MLRVIAKTTELFKDIFPDYKTFKDWYTKSPFSNGGQKIPSETTFRLISNEFNDCHVCLSVEGFKEHFENDIYTYYQEFERTTYYIDKLMALSEDDIAIDGYTIQNIASIPETPDNTDTETVDFISQQEKMINKKGKLQIQRELLSNSRAYTVKTFLNRFRHLFIKIASDSYTRVYVENDMEEYE